MKQKKLKSKKEFIKKIKEKRELSDLADSVIEKNLEDYLSKHKIVIENIKYSDSKLIVKEIRSELRRLTGMFQIKPKKRSKVLEYKELLKTHSSTLERTDFYPFIKLIIKKLNVKSILDLGCGLNPLALANKKIEYYAADIKEDELNIIDSFFKKKGIKGETFVYDLRTSTKKLPKTDLCLMFKVLDIIDDKKHKTSEKIINTIPSKYILVSFSTKKLSGKNMNVPRRLWFEKMLSRRELDFKVYKSENETFYLIKKL